MELKSELKKTSVIQHTLEIEVAWAELEKFVPKAVKWFRGNISIDGFRKGKAPDAAIRGQVGEKHVRERAAEMLAGEAFDKASKDLEKTPIAPPKINIEDIIPGEPIKFTAEYYIQPPSPKDITKEIRDEHYPEIIKPEDIFPDGPPGIQSTGPYPLSPDALKDIPGLNLADQFIPNPLPQVNDPRKSVAPMEPQKFEIPDPEKIIKQPRLPKHLQELKEAITEDAKSGDETTEEAT